MSDSTTKKKLQLTHRDFYLLTKQVELHRDAIAKLTGWEAVCAFLANKVGFSLPRAAGERACLTVDENLRPQTVRRNSGKIRPGSDERDILARAVMALYNDLGKTPGPGLQRLYDIATRRNTVASNGTHEEAR